MAPDSFIRRAVVDFIPKNLYTRDIQIFGGF